jgi:hypothetical protein
MKKQTLMPDDLIINSLTALLKDVGNQFQIAPKSLRRDITTTKNRLLYEKDGFATKTLPALGKSLDKGLVTGVFSPPTSFKRRKRGGALPCYLQGLTRLVFSENGTLLDSPDIEAIKMLRQICFLFYKVEGEYPKELVDEKIGEFVEVDLQLTQADTILPEKAGYIWHAAKLCAQIFSDFSREEILPRPGPGQCSTKLPQWSRYEPSILYDDLHQTFPYYRYFYVNKDHLRERVTSYKRLTRKEYGVSRLETVPKDSRGPRIICMEPPEYMWIQQGIMRCLTKKLESHPLTKGHVNFSDQTINGSLALSSSADGKFATLDMKEASDRVSTSLVEAIFEDCPELLRSLLAASTKYISLPDGRVLPKKKFAPMGSALCFPVMSVVHFTLAVAAIHLATGERYKAIAEQVYVYGDDLIVPTQWTYILYDTFPLFGLKFNPDKSCATGRFRESCGVDAYNGINVTPTRIRKRKLMYRDPGCLPAFLAYYHAFFNKGYWNIAKVMQDEVDRAYGDTLPCVTKTSSALGWIVPREQLTLANSGKRIRQKWCDKLQSVMYKCRTIATRPFVSLYGHEALLKYFVNPDSKDGIIVVTVEDDCRFKLEGWSTGIGAMVERSRTLMRRKWIPLSSM